MSSAENYYTAIPDVGLHGLQITVDFDQIQELLNLLHHLAALSDCLDDLDWTLPSRPLL